MGTKRRALALAVSGALLLLAVSVVVTRVYAHAGYARSQPGAGAVIATAPTQVVIWFGQDMFRRAGENGIEVLGPDGAAVQTGEAAIDDDDRRILSVPLAADLTPGAYTVNWHTLSAEDGDDAEGSFTFTYDPAAAVTSTPMQAEATPTELGQAPTALPAAISTLVAPTATPTSDGGVRCFGLPMLVIGLATLGVGARRRQEQR